MPGNQIRHPCKSIHNQLLKQLVFILHSHQQQCFNYSIGEIPTKPFVEKSIQLPVIILIISLVYPNYIEVDYKHNWLNLAFLNPTYTVDIVSAYRLEEGSGQALYD